MLLVLTSQRSIARSVSNYLAGFLRSGECGRCDGDVHRRARLHFRQIGDETHGLSKPADERDDNGRSFFRRSRTWCSRSLWSLWSLMKASTCPRHAPFAALHHNGLRADARPRAPPRVGVRDVEQEQERKLEALLAPLVHSYTEHSISRPEYDDN